MTKRVSTLVLLFALARPAAAEEDPPPGRLGVAGKLVLVFPQVATELSTTWGVELEASFRLVDRIALFASVGYTQPSVLRSDVSDPRVPGGTYEGEQTQRELTLGVGGAYRFRPSAASWNAYAGLGVRAYFLETVTVGQAGGNELGENTEQSTQVGFVILAGGEKRFGPVAVLVELQFGDSDLPHVITGDVTTGALTLDFGCRVHF